MDTHSNDGPCSWAWRKLALPFGFSLSVCTAAVLGVIGCAATTITCQDNGGLQRPTRLEVPKEFDQNLWLEPSQAGLVASELPPGLAVVPPGFHLSLILRGRVQDGVLKHASQLPHLEEVTVDGATGFSEESLTTLLACPTLRRVTLDSCAVVGQSALKALAENSTLCTLTISKVPSISDDTIFGIATSQSITTLTLTNLPSLSLASLPRLLDTMHVRTLVVGALASGSGDLSRLLNVATLRELGIDGYELSGEFLVKAVESPHIVSLELTDCKLGAGGSWRVPGSVNNTHLSRLSILGTHACKLDPSVFSYCSRFENVRMVELGYLSDSDGAAPRALQGNNVECLSLRGCGVLSDVAFDSIGRLPKLRKLSIVGSSISGAIAPISFDNLTELSIWDAESVGADFLSSLGKCGGLQSLEFHACPTVDLDSLSFVEQLPMLRNLIVDGGGKSDSPRNLFKKLSRLSGLESLTLSGARTISSDAASALADLAGLKRISLRSATLDKDALTAIAGLPALEILDLRYCRGITLSPTITKDDAAPFSRLKALFIRGSDCSKETTEWFKKRQSDLYVAY